MSYHQSDSPKPAAQTSLGTWIDILKLQGGVQKSQVFKFENDPQPQLYLDSLRDLFNVVMLRLPPKTEVPNLPNAFTTRPHVMVIPSHKIIFVATS